MGKGLLVLLPGTLSARLACQAELSSGADSSVCSPPARRPLIFLPFMVERGLYLSSGRRYPLGRLEQVGGPGVASTPQPSRPGGAGGPGLPYPISCAHCSFAGLVSGGAGIALSWCRRPRAAELRAAPCPGHGRVLGVAFKGAKGARVGGTPESGGSHSVLPPPAPLHCQWELAYWGA